MPADAADLTVRQVMFALPFAAAISIVSHRLRFLTAGGAITQFALGWLLLGIGGWAWTIPILLFFVSSSLLSITGKKRRGDVDSIFQKSSKRDSVQVLANGGVAASLLIVWFLDGGHCWYTTSLGSIAAVTADTWGTEIGIWSGSAPRLLLSFRKVERGRSGGVTALGLLASVLGAALIGLSGLPWSSTAQSALVLVAPMMGGIAGSLIDSVLGESLQSQFRCRVCSIQTEQTLHCSSKTVKIQGISGVDNDVVNLAASLVGAAVSYYVQTFYP